MTNGMKDTNSREPYWLRGSWLMITCWAAWIIIGLLPALFFFRFFYADGAYFFMYILEHHSVNFAAEGRAATYLLTQWPTVLALSAGCLDIRWLAWCFGAGYILPLALLHGLFIFILLRRGMHLQALVYIVMLWLMMGYSELFMITDLHTPTAIFMLAVVLVTTFVPEKIGSWLALTVIGALSFALYEFWAFYSCVLLMLLTWRIWPRWSGMSISSRVIGLGTMLIFAASVAINTWRLLHSSDNPNQASLLSMLSWTTYPVYLVLITSWFVGVCGHFWLEMKFKGRPLPRILLSGRSRLWILGIFFALLTVLCAIQHATMVRYSYPFRTLNLILPLIYCVWLVLVTREGSATPVLPGGRGLLVLLTMWLLVNETWMTAGWREYQAWAGDVSRVAGGSIYTAQPPSTSIAKAWIFPWTHSAHSFLSQAIRFRSVKGVGYDPSARWNPYGPGHEDRILFIANKYGIQVE
ncbi:MAG: hypothetical protein PHR77_17685 [Kiritimatiellae bacterium]|nr:hypothetical protein [Kiritimatiellia bacterium]MDD5522673.1 hypothetical protein [Kiritimatiellia bacterium]